MESVELKKILETLLFITDAPLSIKKLASITEEPEEIIKDHIESIRSGYDSSGHALQLRQAAGGWQMATRPEYASWVRKLYGTKMTVRLTQAALETLCIVAYKQPITRAEVEAVRGVDSAGPLDTLAQRRLITVAGRKEVPGRPLLYCTSPEFLRQFGLNSLKDLPKIETFNIDNPSLAAQSTAAELADEELNNEENDNAAAGAENIEPAETTAQGPTLEQPGLYTAENITNSNSGTGEADNENSAKNNNRQGQSIEENSKKENGNA